MKDRLHKYLMDTDGHVGRKGQQMQYLSKKAKVSVAMLQSVANGRRKFSDLTEKRVDRELAKMEAALKSLPPSFRIARR